MDDQKLNRMLADKAYFYRPLGQDVGKERTGVLVGIHQDPDNNFTCIFRTSPEGVEPPVYDLCRVSSLKGITAALNTDAGSSPPKP